MRASQKSKRKTAKTNRMPAYVSSTMSMATHTWSIWSVSLPSPARFYLPFWLQSIFETFRICPSEQPAPDAPSSMHAPAARSCASASRLVASLIARWSATFEARLIGYTSAAQGVRRIGTARAARMSMDRRDHDHRQRIVSSAAPSRARPRP